MIWRKLAPLRCKRPTLTDATHTMHAHLIKAARVPCPTPTPQNKVITLVDQITASASPSKPWRVYITGHSLGGAIATLCAYEISGRT